MKTITIKQALITLVLSSALFFSCKKEKNNEPDCSITMANLSGSYLLTSLQYQANATAVPINYLAFMDACEKDDIVTLKNNGRYDYNDAGTTCTPNGSGNGSWSLSGNVLTSDGTMNGTISSYDCKTLTYYVENVNKNGDKLTFTMVKQ